LVFDTYHTTGTPGGTLLTATDKVFVPKQTRTLFDGAGRIVAAIFQPYGAERWPSTTAYTGDRTDLTPPPGSTATSTVTDARGRTVELRQYHGATATPQAMGGDQSTPAGGLKAWSGRGRGRRGSNEPGHTQRSRHNRNHPVTAYGAYVVTYFWEQMTPEQEAKRSRTQMEQGQAQNAARSTCGIGASTAMIRSTSLNASPSPRASDPTKIDSPRRSRRCATGSARCRCPRSPTGC
jgi:hypothetical protein